MKSASGVSLVIGDVGATVTGTGELDLKSAGKFGSALAEAVASGKPVTVDFLKTDFIDSAILELLVIHGKALCERGERLKVTVATGGYPGQVLKTVGFDCLMDIVGETVEERE